MITFNKINLETRPCHFFSNMINIKDSNPNLLNIDKISFQLMLLSAKLNIS